MTKQINNGTRRWLSCLLAVILLFGTIAPQPAWAAEEAQTFSIRSEDDFYTFAQKASYDAWSQGKTVLLEADLNLTGDGFTAVPIFGGTFEGNGHTVQISLTQSGSHQGLFRYLQTGGVIRDLHVQGTVAPSGSQSYVGGIVGNNSGKIIDCTFDGNVNGESNVGGIAGINESKGEIYGCDVSGNIQGEHYTGGIAGQNLGTMTGCTNKSGVNTAQADYKRELSDLELELDDLENINSTENLNTATDTGGITGYSTGILLGCDNVGTVGYPHVGYNAGGVAGRSSGRIEGCKNSGTVYGRKDVGGIVGQIVPDIILQFSPDAISELEGELGSLQTMTDSLLNHTGENADTLFADMEQISDTVGQARDSAQSLANQTTDWANGNLEEINTASELIFDTLSRTAPLIRELTAVSDTITDGVEQFGDMFTRIASLSGLGDDAIANVEQSIDALRKASADMGRGMEKISEGIDEFKDAAVIGNWDRISAALRRILEGTRELKDALETIQNSVDEIKRILESIQNMGDFFEVWKPVIQLLSDIHDATQDMKGAVLLILDGIGRLPSNPQIDWAGMRDGLAGIADGLEAFHQAADPIDDAFSHLSTALKDIQLAAEEAQVAKQMANIADTFRDAFSQLSFFIDDTETLVRDLSQKEPIHFDGFGSDYQAASDALFGAFSTLSGQIQGMGGNAQTAGDTLLQDFRRISGQFQVIADLMLEALSGKQTEASLYEDTSEEDINAITMGKAEGSQNTGKISGDVNVGGVAGSMAIEYDLDPEDDISKLGDESLQFRFETKAIVQNCVNRGVVTSKKDHAGSIVGLMDLGLVYGCEGYGEVQSTDGGYVGGIAGKSSSTIRKSYAKCTLDGSDHVGGIAGYGFRIKDCRSQIEVLRATEACGTIAGEREPNQTVSGNYFVSDTLAGIDGVSYKGIAEPMDYSAFLLLGDLPDDFRHFALTYIADGTIVETVPFAYGSDLSERPLPEIPKKDGYYGEWEECDYAHLTFDRVIEVVYTPYITTIASESKRDDIHSIFLAEGNFGSGAALAATEIEKGEMLEQWTVSLTGEGAGKTGSYTVRFLPPETGKRVVLYAMTDGGKQEIPYETDGSYLVFTMEGNQMTLGVGEASFSGWIIFSIVFVILLVAAALVFFFVMRKRKKK